ncbi:Pkinase-domain-containing protein, partial [Schizophyllum commune Tattone D]
ARRTEDDSNTPSGQGAFGEVYKARSRLSGQIVALKVTRPGRDTAVSREIAFLKKLVHVNIIRLRDVVHTAQEPTLVLEFCGSDLLQYMQQYGHHGALRPDEVRSFMSQLLQGTAFCHRNWIAHCDLKPSNLLIDSRKVLKLADFGCACECRPGSVRQTLTTQDGTYWYRAPEQLPWSSNVYGASGDVWSCGCVFGEMIQGTPLFQGQDEADQLHCIMRIIGTPATRTLQRMMKDSRWPQFRTLPRYPRSLRQFVPRATSETFELLRYLLKFNPARRITADMALRHPYFTYARAPSRRGPSQCMPTYRSSQAQYTPAHARAPSQYVPMYRRAPPQHVPAYQRAPVLHMPAHPRAPPAYAGQSPYAQVWSQVQYWDGHRYWQAQQCQQYGRGWG